MGTIKRFVATFEDRKSYEKFKEKIFAGDMGEYDDDYFDSDDDNRLEWTTNCSYGYNPVNYLREIKAKLKVTIEEYDLEREPDLTLRYEG